MASTMLYHFSAKKYCYLEGQHSQSVRSLGDREDDPSEEVPASFTKSRCSDMQYNEPDRFLDNTDIDSGEEVPSSVISSANQYNPGVYCIDIQQMHNIKK